MAAGRETAAAIPSARAQGTARVSAGNRAQADSRIEVGNAAKASRITKPDSALPDSVLIAKIAQLEILSSRTRSGIQNDDRHIEFWMPVEDPDLSGDRVRHDEDDLGYFVNCDTASPGQDSLPDKPLLLFYQGGLR